jgi:hypothetical protein
LLDWWCENCQLPCKVNDYPTAEIKRSVCCGAPVSPYGPSVAAAKDNQEGDHYKRFAIQPIDFIVKNHLGWHEGNILKYICRWKFKDGIGDLKKARDYLDKLIELEEAKE